MACCDGPSGMHPRLEDSIECRNIDGTITYISRHGEFTETHDIARSHEEVVESLLTEILAELKKTTTIERLEE